MKVLCFGSEVIEGDDVAIKICENLKGKIPGIEFSRCDDPADVMDYEDEVVILDVVKNLDNVSFVGIDSINKKNMYTLHDFDLAFYLKLAEQMGKTNFKILGIPFGSSAEETTEKVKEMLAERG